MRLSVPSAARLALSLFGGAIVAGSIDILLYSRGLWPIRPTITLIVFGVAPLFILTVEAAFGRGAFIDVQTLRRNVPAILAYAILVMLALALSTLPEANWEGAGTFVLLPILHFTAFVVSIWLASKPSDRAYFALGLRVALIILVGTLGVDVVRPGTFSFMDSRAAGLALNPNRAAYVITALAASSVDFRRTRVADLVLLVAGAVAVFATLSRGGLALYGIFTAAYFVIGAAFQGHPRRAVLRVTLFAVAAIGTFYGVAYVRRSTLYLNDSTAELRITQLAGGDLSRLLDDRLRVQLAKEYAEEAAARPVLGHGTGFSASREVGPHNIYLRQWVDNGIFSMLGYIGLLAFSGLAFARRRCPNGSVFVGIVVIHGFLSHNILDDRVFPVLLGFLLGSSAAKPLWSLRPEGELTMRDETVLPPLGGE